VKRYTNEIFSTETGLPIIGATVSVFVADPNSNDPTVGGLAVLYAQNSIGATVSNPFQATGPFSFYVPDGLYNIRSTAAGRTRWLLNVDIVDTAALVDRVALIPAGPASAFRPALVAIQNASPYDGVSFYNGGNWFWMAGDFTGRTDVVASVVPGFPISSGAWVPQTGNSVYVSASPLVRTAQDVDDDLGIHSGKYVTRANTNGVTNVRASLQAMINAGDCLILSRPQPYAIDGSLVLPPGRKVRIQAGTRLRWLGSDGGAFFTVADDTQLLVEGIGGDWFGECDAPMAAFSVVQGFGVSNVKVTGAFGINCTQAYFEANSGSGTPYSNVVIPEMVGTPKPGGGNYAEGDVNVCQKISIAGGGCTATTGDPSDSATWLLMRSGALMVWCYDWIVEGGDYSYCYSPVQSWGGDSGFGPGKQGDDPDLPRKNKNGTVRNTQMRYGNAGVWGSMCRDIVISGNRCQEVLDVGFDAEGFWNAHFINNYAEDCYNGNYATFAYNRNVLFENNVSVVNNSDYPLFRLYNSSLNPLYNTGVRWVGGKCISRATDKWASFDSDFGPAMDLSIEHSEFRNVRISVPSSGINPNVSGNRMYFDVANPTATAAIDMAGAQQAGTGLPPLTTIKNNRIYSLATQVAGTHGVRVSGGDANANPDVMVSQNNIRIPRVGGWAGIHFIGIDAGNPGTSPYFVAEGNELDGTITKVGVGTAYARNNYNPRSAEIPIT
jgi:hypothetical protein